MLCSKCKSFSIHLSNYDSFICEYGHVVCRTCSKEAQNTNRCSICNGKIVRQTKFYLEGAPKTVYRMLQQDSSHAEICSGEKYDSGMMLGPVQSQISRSWANVKNLLVPEKYSSTLTNWNAHQSGSSRFALECESELSDSSTVMRHLYEFRQATNYTPPSKLAAIKVHNVESFVKLGNLLASKTRSPSKSRSQSKFQISKSAQTLGSRKVDACTSMEMNGIQDLSSPSNSPTVEPPPPLLLSKTKRQSDIRTYIRDKLKNEIYSSFPEKQSSGGNSFMVKGELTDIPSHIILYDATAVGKDNFLAATINAEIERALKNLNVRFDFPCLGHRRRDEIVKQSKNLLRQRILEEVYAPFETNDIYNSSGTSESNDGTIIDNGNYAGRMKLQESINSENNGNLTSVKETQQNSQDSSRKNAHPTVDSYPKLTTNLSMFVKSGNGDSESFTEDAYIQEASVFQSNESFTPVFSLREDSKNQIMERSSSNTDIPLSCGVLSEKDSLRARRCCSSNECGLSTANTGGSSYSLPKGQSASDEVVEVEKLVGNVVYFCNTFTANHIESKPAILCEATSKVQMGDCLDEAANCIHDFLEGEFIQVIREQYPHIHLEDLKAFLRNICFTESQEETNDHKPEVVESLHQLHGNEYPTSDSLLRKINAIASRAYFAHMCTACCLPPQYQTLPPWDDVSTEIRPINEIPTAQELNIPRSPVICPITSCRKLVFVTEFASHIKYDHRRTLVQSIHPGAYKNVFLDTKLATFGINKCNILFLLSNKIKNLGSKELKDFLPVALMSTRISVADMVHLDVRGRKQPLKEKDNCIMIWLTGITFSQLPIYYTLIAWSRTPNLPKCHIAHTGQVYSIRNNQDYRSVFKSGQCLLLKYEHWMLLSNQGKDLLELQVVLY